MVMASDPHVRFPNDATVHDRSDGDADRTKCDREIPPDAVTASHYDPQLFSRCTDCRETTPEDENS